MLCRLSKGKPISLVTVWWSGAQHNWQVLVLKHPTASPDAVFLSLLRQLRCLNSLRALRACLLSKD